MTIPTMLIVAHPDDETLGGAHLLLRQPSSTFILHTTNGAPAESRFWQQAGVETREAYAAARQQELHAALAVFGITSTQQQTLPFGDRDLPRNLVSLTQAILRILRQHKPAVVYTHPFEGGHPDHDATAYAVHRAVASWAASSATASELREFSGYHAREGEFFSGAFLDDAPAERVDLSDEECTRKRLALDCHQSQQRVIQRFALSPQLWRRAPSYDFTKRPQQTPLYYEIREMGYTFADFANYVRLADHELPAVPNI